METGFAGSVRSPFVDRRNIDLTAGRSVVQEKGAIPRQERSVTNSTSWGAIWLFCRRGHSIEGPAADLRAFETADGRQAHRLQDAPAS